MSREANIRDYGAALDLVWEAVAQQTVGVLPAREHITVGASVCLT